MPNMSKKAKARIKINKLLEEISGAEVSYHFADIGKMIGLTRGAQMSFQIMQEENELALNRPVHIQIPCKLIVHKE